MSKFSYISKVGAETEGAFFKPRKDLHQDDSLLPEGFPKTCEIAEKNDTNLKFHIGEVISNPFDNIADLISFIKDNQPDEISERSSFHLHFSFKKISAYECCMTKHFYKNFLKAMKEFGEENHITNEEFWSRLEGNNRYCLRKFNGIAQLKIKTKPNPHRYTHLNYCYSMHKTFECRLFPTFVSYKTAQIAAKALIDFIEGYLEQNPPVELNKKFEIIEEEIAPKKIEIPKFNYFELKKKEKLGRNYQVMQDLTYIKDIKKVIDFGHFYVDREINENGEEVF